MPVTAVNSLSEFQEIIAKDELSVFDFWAEWCGPCRFISPEFEKLSESNSNVKFYKVDVDAQAEISQEVGIRAMPTFIVYKKGGKVNEVVGANREALSRLVSEAV